MKRLEKSRNKYIRAIVYILFFTLLIFIKSLYSTTVIEKENEQNKVKQKKSDLIFLPLVFYSPETKIAGGAGGIFTFRTEVNDLKSRPSSIQMIMYYTLNKQFLIEIKPDLYIKEEDYHLKGSVSYMKFLDKFYGIGNKTTQEMEEKYTSFITRIKLSLLKKILSNLSVGLEFEFESNNVIEVEEDGQLASGEILGSEGGISSGIGALLNWDSRDNIFFPKRGFFFQFSAKLFGRTLGGDYIFSKYNLDFRKYLSLFSTHVLAFQGYIDVITGDPPLQILPRLGGQNIMRGYYRGRYRDKNLVAFQIEYRMPVWKRIGLVGFLGFGDVSDKLRDFRLRSIRPTIGLGIRYQINREERMNVRLDIGFSKESSGVYFNISEAF